ncbi:hypothetical protein ACFLQ6_05520 [Thermoproteota archaeon]
MQRTILRRTHPQGGVQHKPLHVTNAINRLINISCASVKIESLTIKQKHRDLNLRPQLHIILQSGPGSLKSTILEEIGVKHNVTSYSYVSYAAMIGTIDPSTGDSLPGLVWMTRNKPLLLDEFKTGERGDTGSLDVLLGVLESGRYKRKVGQRTRPFNKEDGELYYRVKDGEIEVKTRFPCIIATMKNLDMSRSIKYPALTQRCIPIRFNLSENEIDDILQGKQFYKHQEFKVKNEVTISRKDYDKILEIARKIRSNNPDFQNVYARAVGDICRITAILGKIDLQLTLLVCYMKFGYKIDQALHLVDKEKIDKS